ncbi:MAG: hypothetical protein ACHQNT_09280 [Bacteroidia bacterium]
MKNHYLPDRDSDRVTWLNNFAAKLPAYNVLLGITAAELALVQAYALFYSYIIGLIELSKTYTENLTKFKNLLSRASLGSTLGPLPVLTPAAAPPAADAGIFTIISGFVARMKASQQYTEAIGEDLGIVGDESDFDELTYKPEIKAKSVPGGARVTFTKKGVDGIDFQSRPKGSTAWEKLAFDSQSPYVDTRPPRTPGVPEEREYRGRGVISDVEIGEWSDIISVTVTE